MTDRNKWGVIKRMQNNDSSEEQSPQTPVYRSSSKRIAKNTLMLYFRQILIMLVSLYTVRVILNTLGAVDYGIYNVVAGVVTMFSFLSGAMATASQRYFAFEMGRGDEEALKKTFSVTLCIYLLLIAIIVFFAETVGLWFVHYRLVIPAERFTAAKWIYQFSILSFIVSLITAPYMAAIIAHENMKIYAYMSIVEAVLKLMIVFVLRILPYDRLIVYGILLFSVTFINTAIYRAYCKRHYSECVFHPVWNKEMFREIWGFTGWSLFGTFSTMARTQAITVLVNQFFTPVVVAARSVSSQITGALNVFSSNFNTSLYAPIVKEYAGGHKKATYALIFSGCKMTFFLMWVFALPLFLRMEYVLTLWLKHLPEYVVLFARLSLIEALITSISLPLMTAARASGKVRAYELILGTMQLLMFVASYVWLKFFNGGPETVFITAIILVSCMFFARILIVRRLTGLPVWEFVIKVFLPVGFISLLSLFPTVLADRYLPQNFIALCLVSGLSVVISSVLMFFIGLNADMRTKVIRLAIRRRIR